MAPRAPETAFSHPGGSPRRGWTSEGSRKSPKGRGAGGKPPKTWPHWRSEARRAVFRAGRRSPLSLPGSRDQPKGAEKGSGRPDAPAAGPDHPPATGWDEFRLPTAGAARDGTRPSLAGPGGKSGDTPGLSGRLPSGPDGSHHAVQTRRANPRRESLPWPFSAEVRTSGNPGNWR